MVAERVVGLSKYKFELGLDISPKAWKDDEKVQKSVQSELGSILGVPAVRCLLCSVLGLRTEPHDVLVSCRPGSTSGRASGSRMAQGSSSMPAFTNLAYTCACNMCGGRTPELRRNSELSES